MITFRVPDMTCGHCASVITMAVAGVDKAARSRSTFLQGSSGHASTAAERELMEAIQAAGYPPQKFAPSDRRARLLARRAAAARSRIPRLLTQVKELRPASSACCS